MNLFSILSCCFTKEKYILSYSDVMKKNMLSFGTKMLLKEKN